MLTPFAFVQSGADSIACLEGRLHPVARPRPGTAALFAPDFALSAGRPSWFDTAGQAPSLMSRGEWSARFPVPVAPVRLPSWGAPDQARFHDAFGSLREHLDAGTLRKGVPVSSMSAAMTHEEAATLFRALLARVPALPAGLMAYGLFLPGSSPGDGPQFVIGATPEILFELDGGCVLSTMAVAGTRPADEAEALASSPKDCDEHQAVVDDLLEQLSEWGEPRVSRVEVRRFGRLAHLVADLCVESRTPLDLETVARRLHPTPALGVSPRSALGRAWLAAIDPGGERNRFGAPFGLRWPSGGGRVLVAIRNLQYARGRLEIWAGCGVVAMSRYDDEWREVLEKMDAVRALWGV